MKWTCSRSWIVSARFIFVIFTLIHTSCFCTAAFLARFCVDTVTFLFSRFMDGSLTSWQVGFLWKTVWTRLGILARGPLRNCFMGGASRTSTILLHVLDHHLSSGYILLRSAFCSASCPVVDPRREKFARVLSVVVICGALPPRYGLFGQLGSLWFWWLVVCWLRGYLPSCLFYAVALHFLHALLFLFLVASECCMVPSVSKFGNLLRHGWIEFVVANLEKSG